MASKITIDNLPSNKPAVALALARKLFARKELTGMAYWEIVRSVKDSDAMIETLEREGIEPNKEGPAFE